VDNRDTREFIVPSPDLVVENPGSPTGKARAARLTQTAHRAVDNPVELARAARIVRAALARKRISLDELSPLPPVRSSGGAA
jgi:hypothetical protein